MEEEITPEQMWASLRASIAAIGETVEDVPVIPNKLFMSRLHEALRDLAKGSDSLLLWMMEIDAEEG